MMMHFGMAKTLWYSQLKEQQVVPVTTKALVGAGYDL